MRNKKISSTTVVFEKAARRYRIINVWKRNKLAPDSRELKAICWLAGIVLVMTPTMLFGVSTKESRYKHVQMLLDSGDLKSARDEFEAWSRSYPDELRITIMTAKLHRSLSNAGSNRDVCTEDFKSGRALESLPANLTNTDVLLDCGKLLLEMKRFADARKFFQRIVTDFVWDKNRPAALFYKAECDRTLGNDQKAQAGYDEFVHEYPNDPLGSAVRYRQSRYDRSGGCMAVPPLTDKVIHYLREQIGRECDLRFDLPSSFYPARSLLYVCEENVELYFESSTQLGCRGCREDIELRIQHSADIDAKQVDRLISGIVSIIKADRDCKFRTQSNLQRQLYFCESQNGKDPTTEELRIVRTASTDGHQQIEFTLCQPQNSPGSMVMPRAQEDVGNHP